MKRLLLFMSIAILKLSTSAETLGPIPWATDGLSTTDSVMANVVRHLLPGHNELLCPLPYYDCVHYDRIALRFPAGHEAQDHFYDKLDSLLLFHSRDIRVWHIGGSHVQADFFSHRMRTHLATMQPGLLAERGLLFPYGMVPTNWNHNYRITWTGQWETGRCTQRDAETSFDLGVTGIAASTSDTLASLSLVLNVGLDPSWQFSRLRILGYETPHPYDTIPATEFSLYAVEQTPEGRCDTLHASLDSLTMSYVIDYGMQRDSTTLYIRIPTGHQFTLTGLLPENDETGITYFSSGINGASLSSWQRCRHLERDLQLVRPDLVIFAIGINDANVPTSEFNVTTFKDGYRQLIHQIKAVSPDCTFIFITNNDTHRRISRRTRRPNANAITVQQAMNELAAEQGACVWDVFEIMGGLGSSTAWRNVGLMTSDLVHFTRTGYELLGDMLYNAIISDYMQTE